MGKKVGDKTFLAHNLFSSELQVAGGKEVAIRGKGVKALHVMGCFCGDHKAAKIFHPFNYLFVESFPLG